MTEHKEQQHEPSPAQDAQHPTTPSAEQEHIVRLMRQHSLANALRLHRQAVPK